MARLRTEAATAVLLLVLLVRVAAAQELRPVYVELGPLGEGVNPEIVERASGGLILYAVNTGPSRPVEWRVFERATGTWSGIGDGLGADATWSPVGDRLAAARPDEEGRGLYVWVRRTDPASGRPVGVARRVSIRSARGPAFSPDGRWLAMTTIPPTDTAAPRIVVVPAAGGEERLLVRQPGWTQQLQWSPDARWIYYRERVQVGPPPYRRGLARVPAEGGEPETLREIDDFIGISPDGRFLAYYPIATEPKLRMRIVGIATADGIEVGRFTLPRDMVVSAWAASGLKLLATRSHDPAALRIVSVTGAERELAAGSVRFPSWSPDGGRIAYQSVINDRLQYMIMDDRGGPRRQLVTREEPDPGAAIWSVDGRYLAFVSDVGRQLNVVEIAAGAEAVLAKADGVFWVTWRRDGRALLYERRDGVRRSVHEVTLGGHDAMVRELVGDLGGNARIQLIGDSVIVAGSRNGVYVAPMRGSGVRRLYAPGSDEGANPSYATQVPVSRDGRWAAVLVGEAPGTLHILPLEGGAGRRVPMELAVSLPGLLNWHPDGMHLLARGQQRLEDGMDLFLIPLNGEPIRRLTTSDHRAGTGGYVVSPDGSRIAHVVLTGSSTSLWELDLNQSLAPFAAGISR